MQDVDSIQDKPIADRDSASSVNRLIDNSSNNDNINRDPSFTLDTKTKENTEKTKKNRRSTPSPPLSPADQPTFSGPFGISVASTIFWYVCICILFVIAFVSLVLSVLYFVTDTSKEQVIKLYGICGSGALAIVTFVIIFLDCCNDSSRKQHEQEVLYRTLQEREQKKKEIALRHKRRIAEGKEAKPKPFIIQHQRSQKVEKERTPPLPPPPHHHHHHIHPPLFPPPTSYHHPFVCPICHDLHASGNARHNLNDIAVDTSDKFAPAPKKNRIVHKSTRDAQTEPKLWDSERGTQTDRTEGTQTSAMELSGMPSNITQIIHETTILKAPRSLIGTLKKSMAQQDKDIAINHAVTDSYTSPTNFN